MKIFVSHNAWQDNLLYKFVRCSIVVHGLVVVEDSLKAGYVDGAVKCLEYQEDKTVFDLHQVVNRSPCFGEPWANFVFVKSNPNDELVD